MLCGLLLHRLLSPQSDSPTSEAPSKPCGKGLLHAFIERREKHFKIYARRMACASGQLGFLLTLADIHLDVRQAFEFFLEIGADALFLGQLLVQGGHGKQLLLVEL
jgi:hypothetical protein